MDRNAGYYWVKVKDNGMWLIAYYYPLHNCWSIIDQLQQFYNSDFEEIDENQIIRNNG
jgi:hypothetical protein